MAELWRSAMKLPLIIAHGQGMLTFILVVIPAAILGFVSLMISFCSFCREEEGYKKRMIKFGVAGVMLFIFTYVAMKISADQAGYTLGF